MYPHRIRLRGPWECEPLVRTNVGPLPPPLRMTLPTRWADTSLAGFAGIARFRRHFGYPGRIDDYERVWLTVAGIADRFELHLNETPLGEHLGDRLWETEVTQLLETRNNLCLDIGGDENGGPWGEIALEVRRQAFLSDVDAKLVDGQLHLIGRVIGEEVGMLEVCAVVGRRFIGRVEVEVGATSSFHLIEPLPEMPEDEAQILRVDLIQGGSVWYSLERMLS